MQSIKEIQNKTDWSQFIGFPYKLYKNEGCWVPPLRISQKSLFDLNKNPFWKLCDHAFFLAEKNGRTVGRIAAIIHHEYLQLNKVPTGFFGFLEAEDDPEIFNALLNCAGQWLKDRGCEKVIGPVNPSINYEMGILTKGFDLPPYLMLTWNYAYYSKYLEKAGFQKEMDFYAYYTGRNAPTLKSKLDRIIEITRKKYDLKVRKVNKKNFHSELAILHSIYNDAFQSHYGFVPMTETEFEFMGSDMRQIVDEDFLLIAEYNGEPIGFILALPNYNEVFKHIRDGKLFPLGLLKFLYYKRKIQSVRVLTIAICHKYRHLGIGAYLYREIIRQTEIKGTVHGEMSWVAEDNVQMNKVAVEMGAVIYKEYRLYNKLLV